MTRSQELLREIRWSYAAHPLVLELAQEYEIAIAQALSMERVIHEIEKQSERG